MNTPRSRYLPYLAIGLIGLGCSLALLLTLDPNSTGPGMTCDEYYYSVHGKRLWHALISPAEGYFRLASVERNFGPMHEHPPLAALCLGMSHALFDARPAEPDAIWLPGARLASATAFALLVILVGLLTNRAGGSLAGVVAAVTLALMPRASAHAHFAALDLITASFSFAALAALEVASQATLRQRWHFAAAGVVWGLAMLCKLNGFLLALPLALWIILSLRRRALVPLLVWALGGLLTFFAGWPWLWPAPKSRLATFLSASTDRIRIHNFYGGRAWLDIETPWHYPWVMTLVTIPIGLLLLAAVGIWVARHSTGSGRLARFMVLNAVCLLAVFSVPGVPVYDGARLFLLIYPLLAVLAGIGATWLVHVPSIPHLPRGVVLALLAVFVLLQGAGTVRCHPFQLSYYNALCGGIAGAERRGFELSYWGDSLNGTMFDAAIEQATGGQLLYAPSLAPWQVPATVAVFPQLATHGVELVPLDAEQWNPTARWIVVYRRRAADATWQPAVATAQVVAEHAVDGVWLSRLYQLPQENR